MSTKPSAHADLATTADQAAVRRAISSTSRPPPASFVSATLAFPALKPAGGRR